MTTLEIAYKKTIGLQIENILYFYVSKKGECTIYMHEANLTNP
jgi:hypothetical protein